ncbi:hypothetical protein SARC_02809 [Sphaeroforma arctica JP610]|uniref:aminodeoxychorismate synthase n=1 Tax=Sphaeroforma arctica JP610 TaxID=667725 RepID=A0A0L0G7T7_9EUKA|nr:hypothetical protein SARC_02809 [Sphaeroforma arctica JP610]KNC84989.1 hypothetical protein SARC_02809 [Sphaeroforma arctica JP610]|eukprot:XP_014158891.1 hypothetical protein SARC_02809 [Sphaeroforma arctica JP610]
MHHPTLSATLVRDVLPYFDNVVISPGPGDPTCDSDFGVNSSVLKESSIPIFGVCLGHQGMAALYGARVVPAPQVMHGRLSSVTHRQSRTERCATSQLFDDIPSPFSVVRYHSLVVAASDLPCDLEAIAHSDDGVLMALRHRSHPHWGVQFHPESICTQYGATLLANFRNMSLQWNANEGSLRARIHCQATLQELLHKLGLDTYPHTRAHPSERKQDRATPGPALSSTDTHPATPREDSPEVHAALGAPPLAQEAYTLIVAQWDDLKTLSSEDIFLELFGDAEPSWWLDSSRYEAGLSRFSFMGDGLGPYSETLKYEVSTRTVAIEHTQQHTQPACTLGTYARTHTHTHVQGCVCADACMNQPRADDGVRVCTVPLSDEECFLQFMNDRMDTHHRVSEHWDYMTHEPMDVETIPFELHCGYVGYLGYELKEESGLMGTLTAEQKATQRAAAAEMVYGTKTQPQQDTPTHTSTHQQQHTQQAPHAQPQAQPQAHTSEDGPTHTQAGIQAQPQPVKRPEIQCHMRTQLPTCTFLFADRQVVVDHETRRVWAMALCRSSEPETVAEADAWFGRTRNTLLDLCERCDSGTEVYGERGARRRRSADSRNRRGTDTPTNTHLDHQRTHIHVPELTEPKDSARSQNTTLSNNTTHESHSTGKMSDNTTNNTTHVGLRHGREKYYANIAAALRLMGEGETYEVCLTTQLKVPTDGPVNPLALHQHLRTHNPAPYACLFRFGCDQSIVGSSPEKFLTVDRNGSVESKPIKGTRRRGITPEEDFELVKDLATDPKDFAENLMIVDLIRNDLGQVCVPSSVHVPKLMHIETYATVHQLVTTVRGELRDGVGALDCLRECFPPGSMTGAPKHRTVQLLEHLEGAPRGVYSGAMGYVSTNGSADMCVTIRTVTMSGEGLTIGAGGAIVAMSDASDEFDEMLLKAKAPIRSILCSMGRANQWEARELAGL